MFYIYEWYDKDTGYIFYVGKGCKKRRKSMTSRNELFKEYFSSHNCESRIVESFESETDALEAERKRILDLKKIGQCSCNLDNGGTGGVNFIWTEEMRQYKSEHNPMKNDEQKKRMSDQNPMKDEEIAKVVGVKHRKPVVINGVKYSGVLVASKEIGVCPATLKKWCTQGYDYNGNPCRYESELQTDYVFEQYNLGTSRRIVYKGKEYPSAVWIAKEIGCHYSTIHKWAKKGFDPQGNPCTYCDDHTEHVFIPPNKTPTAKPIEVNGVIYPSAREAERRIGLYPGTLHFYLAGQRKNNKYVCRYVNQQPSREKSDKSTPEGSTTNG